MSTVLVGFCRLWIVVGLLVAGFAGCGDSNAGTSLPIMATVPAFELTNEQGQTIVTDDLRGDVWIANFIFTTCPTSCVQLTRMMGDIQNDFADTSEQPHLISVTVDPEHDTPEVLRQYGERFGADPEHWSFLTGPSNEVQRAVTEGFRVAMGERGAEAENYDIVHSQHFILVDRENRIRGYYGSTAGDQESLRRDARALLSK